MNENESGIIELNFIPWGYFDCLFLRKK